MYYTIKDAANKIGLKPSTLRYYEKEGLLPFIKRDKNGNRIYDENDFEWLNLIEYLKATGLSIKDIKNFIDLYKQGDSTIKERKLIFDLRKKAIEKKLEEVNNMLDIVNYKCWYYDKALKDGTLDNVKNMNINKFPDDIKKGKIKLSCFYQNK